MVDQRGLANTSPGNDCNDARRMKVGPPAFTLSEPDYKG
jgi:hypothetical protein